MSDRYEIIEKLGSGGEATIWKAWDTRLSRYVALKRLLPPSQQAITGTANLFEEATAISAVQHPNIVQVYDVQEDKKVGAYLVMEFLNGENLEQTVKRGALTEQDFIGIATQSLEGLAAAHKSGMLHRDLKPSNIMLSWLPDRSFVVKLLDFGLAKFTSRPHQQTTHGQKRIAGSFYFMAPEQFNHQPMEPRSDLYSLGCLFYFLLSTKYPFDGETPGHVMQSHLDHMVAPLRDVRPDVRSTLCDWVMWLMRRQPEMRPRDCMQALDILQKVVRGELHSIPQTVTGLQTTSVAVGKETTKSVPPPAAAPPPAGETVKLRPRWPWIAAGGAVAAVALAVVLWPNGNTARIDATRDGGTKTPPRTTPSGSSPGNLPGAGKQLPTLLARDGLTLWLIASHGVLASGGSAVAQAGEKVASWLDQESLTGGSTDFTVPKELSPEGKDQSPMMVEITDRHGLAGTHQVVQFSGNQSLINKVTEDAKIAGGLLDGTAFTIFMVARLRKQPNPVQQRFLAAKCATELKAWDLSWERDALRGGIRKEKGIPDRSDMPFPLGEDFFVMGFVRDGTKGACEVWMRTRDGKDIAAKQKIAGKFDHGPLKVLRLGSMAEFKTQRDADFFTGDIAEVLIYNRPLDSKTRAAMTNDLAKRYFGK